MPSIGLPSLCTPLVQPSQFDGDYKDTPGFSTAIGQQLFGKALKESSINEEIDLESGRSVPCIGTDEKCIGTDVVDTADCGTTMVPHINITSDINTQTNVNDDDKCEISTQTDSPSVFLRRYLDNFYFYNTLHSI